MIIREVLPEEAETVGALRVEAYASGGLLEPNPAYADKLRGLGYGRGTVLVAVDETDGKLLGTVMLDPWGPDSAVACGAAEAEVRMLAVAPRAQGRGVARALMVAVIETAAASAVRTLLLSTSPRMPAAQHIYQSLGFVRLPERDLYHAPGFKLLTYQRPLVGATALRVGNVVATG